MTRHQAIAARRYALSQARLMAWYASRKDLPWGYRYEAAVVCDDCLDTAQLCDDLIRQFAEACP